MHRNKRLNRVLIVCGLIAATVLVCSVAGIRNKDRVYSGLLLESRRAFSLGEYTVALELADRAQLVNPDSPEADLLIGQIAAEQGDFVRVASAVKLATKNVELLNADQLHQAAELFLLSGHVRQAEAMLRTLLTANSGHREARLRLMFLLRLEGRHFELEPLVRESIVARDCPSEFLFVTGWPDRVWVDSEDRTFIAQCLERNPDEVLIRSGVLDADGEAPAYGQADERYEVILRELIRDQPDFAHAQALWGRLLANSSRWDELDAWDRALPDAASAHPEIWYVRGLRALAQGKTPVAIRCFWETLKRSSNHPGATYQLSRLLPGTPNSDAAVRFEEQSRKLARLKQLIVFGEGRGGFPTEATIRAICDVLEELGRLHEVSGWCQIALQRNPAARWAATRPGELQSQLVSADSLVTEQANLARQFDLSDYPLPVVSQEAESTVVIAGNSRPSTGSSIRFLDEAAIVGLKFHYQIDFNGEKEAAVPPLHAYMFEISGGGVGVLDYDRDGWPDLYLTQGAEWPPGQETTQLSDALFRNVESGGFFDATELASISAGGFGQGPAVGDINSDGWPDLFVANIGDNRMYRNNGDGTFSDVTNECGCRSGNWSIGAALADLNGDAAPDLYVVNYLQDAALFRQCEREGRPVQCRPTMFPAEQDRVFLSDLQGSFNDVTESSGFTTSHGKGMGIIVTDLGHRSAPDIVVANDTTANVLFQRISLPGQPPLFAEVGNAAGVAFGESGQMQASMGIASGDVNGDGLLDMFVTNFAGQANNLFIQTEPGMFIDQSRACGVFQAGFPLMGWGTCFLDADLDGHPDLVVANGHLEDYSALGIDSRMRTQLFRQSDGVRFEELSAEAVGPWFGGERLGRAVAKLDWNRDGREDFCVTHVDAPLALLTNRSEPAGHWLVLRLTGTTSDRDAVGTLVQIETGNRSLWAQVVAGGGFQASHQQQLLLGLGDHVNIRRLRVRWPSGLEQTYADVPTDVEVHLVEGNEDVFELP